MDEIPFVLIIGPNPVADFEGKVPAVIDAAVPLDRLSVEELHRVVAWANISTEAVTESGLKRAIERHYE